MSGLPWRGWKYHGQEMVICRSRVVAAEGLSGSYLLRVEKGWFECGYLEPEEQKGWSCYESIWQTL